MPAWIDAVEYGKFGNATVTATLFGGMDESLYADFRKDAPAMINAVENTLKHTHGAYSSAHMASRGSIIDIVRTSGEIPFGSSGIQIRFQTDLIIEGLRPGRVVRIRPDAWPVVTVPREEYLNDANNDELEALRWLLTPDDTLAGSPLDALRAGRKTEIRRRAQALGF